MALGEWGKSKPPRQKKPPTVDLKRRIRFAVEADRFRKDGWENAEPGHFVALYAACHEQVYGFKPHELESGTTYALARFACSGLLRVHCEGDKEMLASFIRWTWIREESREKWRRENAKDGGRIGWRWQFNASLISEWRLAIARRSK